MISPVNLQAALPALKPISSAGLDSPVRSPGASLSFQDVLIKSIEQVNEIDRQSQSMIAGALTGDDFTQAEIFTAVKKADLAFRTMLQSRNKLLDAYNEIKNLRM